MFLSRRLLPSGKGRFQGGLDLPDGKLVEIEVVAVAGIQRLKIEDLGRDIGQGSFAIRHGMFSNSGASTTAPFRLHIKSMNGFVSM